MDSVSNKPKTSSPSPRTERSSSETQKSPAHKSDGATSRPAETSSRSGSSRSSTLTSAPSTPHMTRRNESSFSANNTGASQSRPTMRTLAASSTAAASSDNATKALRQLERVEAHMSLRMPVDKAVELRLLRNDLSPNKVPMPTDTVSMGQRVLHEAEEQIAQHGGRSSAPVSLLTLVDDLKKAGKSADKIQKIFDERGLHIRTPEDIHNGTPPPRPTLTPAQEISQLERRKALDSIDFPADRSVRLDYLQDTQGTLGKDDQSVAKYLKMKVEEQKATYGGSMSAPVHLINLSKDLDKVAAGKASLEQVLADYAMQDPRR